MDFPASLKYVFLDKAWFRKLAVLALYGLIPLLGFLVIGGWGLKVGKMVMDGHEEKALPKVKFSTDLQIGFLASVIDIIYALPAAIFFIMTFGLARIGLNRDDEMVVQ